MTIIEKEKNGKMFIINAEENLKKCEIKKIRNDFYKVAHSLKESNTCMRCVFNLSDKSSPFCKECEDTTFLEYLDVYDYTKHNWNDAVTFYNHEDGIKIQYNKSIKYDNVKQPKHYMLEIGNVHVEVLDIIKATLTPEEFRGFLKGNVIKYILRERNKNGIEDIKKCKQYCEFMVKEND